MKLKKITKLPLLLIGLMIIGGLILYPQLGDKIPTHWNASGQVDAWADKSMLSVLAIPLGALGLYLLFLLFPLIDPKKRNFEKFTKTYNLIINITIAFFAFIFALTMVTSLNKNLISGSNIEIFFILITSLLIIVVGNYMGKLKQNWLIGLRTPWTLSNEIVWNKSNRFSGKLMVILGLLGPIIAFLPIDFKGIIFVTLLILVTVISVIYSFLIFREIEKPGNT